MQFRSEPGTGGVVERIDGGIARVRTPRRRLALVDSLRLTHPNHERRVRDACSFGEQEWFGPRTRADEAEDARDRALLGIPPATYEYEP